MASTSASHIRSSSWPEDVHPLTRAIEDHLLELTQSRSVCRKLGVLKNLYDVFHDFLHLSMTHEASTDLEDVSDGFLRVLDICSVARDVFLQVKEHVAELESTLRRRNKLGDACVAQEIDAYTAKRSSLRRKIERDLKQMTKRNDKNKKRKKKGLGRDSNVLKQVEEKSFEVLVFLLSVLSENHKGRGFVSKMFHPKDFDCEEEGERDEIGLMGTDDLERLKRGNVPAAVELQKLKERGAKIQEIELDLECVYRKLVKTRVSLLNMLTY